MAADIIGYVRYTIFFQDKAEYNAAVATAGGTGYPHCPENAAATFGISWPPPSGDLALIPKGIYDGWISVGPKTARRIDGFSPVPTRVPGPVYLYTDTDSVYAYGTAGTPPSIWPATANCTFIWEGVIIWMPAEVTGAPPVTPIPQRRWIAGFEHVGTLVEGGTVVYVNARAASRVTGGQGFRIRGNSGTSYTQTQTIATYRPGLTPKTSWERFYIRINALGTNELIIWRAQGNNPTQEGATLRISSAGVPLLYNATGATTGTLEATSPTTLQTGKWYLFDLLLTWPAAAGNSGGVRLYINHNLDCQYSINTGVGMDRVTYHQSSTIGQISTRESYWEVDLDDWICSDVPEYLGVESLNSLDWVYGSHIKAINVTGANVGNYTGGEYPVLNQYFNPSLATSQLTSSTALEKIQSVTTDYSDIPDPLGIPVGPVAMNVEINAWNQVNQVGRIGYSIAGGGMVYANINVNASHLWLANLWLPTGLTVPVSIYPLGLEFERPNSANITLVNAFGAIVEYIGVWGQEDDPLLPVDLSNTTFQHNNRYHNTSWVVFPFIGVQAAPVYAIGGTYTSTGDSIIIDVPAPPHFIFVRGVTTNNIPIMWCAAGMGCHEGGDPETSQWISRVWADDTGYHISITGVNYFDWSGRTYEYIIFCDPGMRFNYCDAYAYAAARGSVSKALFDPTWLAEGGFIQPEILQSLGGTVELLYKGPGHAGTTGVGVNGTDVANFGSFAAGQLNIGADNLDDTDTSQFNFSLWRMLDNNGEVMTQIFTYTGDGTSSRNIPFPMTTDRWPLFAMVMPSNGTDAYFRDPSHTGNNSQLFTSSTGSATAIIGGGKDLITVGTTINTLGVVYEVFIILGDDDGWNNGTFFPGFGTPTGPWVNPPSSGEPIIVMDGGMDFNGAAPYLALEDASGIYVLVPEKKTDTIYPDSSDATLDVAIPEPMFKTGYIGG